MTDNIFAPLLAGVRRYPILGNGNVMYESDVLAALAAAVPADLAEAVGRLELAWIALHGHKVANPVHSILARIAAQEAQIKGLEAERDKAALWATEQHASADNYALRLGQEKARAEAAETALAAQEAERDELAERNKENSRLAEDNAQGLREAETALAASEARVAKLVEALDKARAQDRDPDYCYDEEWEYTMGWSEWPDLVEQADLTKPTPIYTLYKGPTKWVVQIPLDTDGDGETDDVETKMFDSEEAALAAITEASQ